MSPARLSLREEDVVRLTLEFLNNRELHISQLSLERETGVINGQYSDDVLFLRQLILDGQWDDVVEFIQPLEALQNFDMKQFRYTILRHKYIELLCIRSEAGGLNGPPLINNVEGAVEEVVQVLGELEKLCPTKEEYSGLCLLLTLPKLGDHMQYRDWNPSKARVQCFREIFPLVEKFLPGDKKAGPVQSVFAKNDRLVQLMIKGILYESCVNYCQVKATGAADAATHKINFSKVLDGSIGFTDSDLSLLSWLQSIPAETFSVPFEQKTLNVDVERLEKPSLETSWTEHMLITPIKPKTFPHSVMPFTRPRSAADIMTRSLLPSLDAVSSCLNPKANNESFPMSRSSFASFHLTGIKPTSGKLMTSSVDRLFENGDGGDVYRSSNFSEYQQGLPSIEEIASVQSKSPELQAVPGAVVKTSDIHQSSAERDSPNTTNSTAKSSRRDSLTDKIATTNQPVPTGLPNLTSNNIQHPPLPPPSVGPPPPVTPPVSSSSAASSNHHPGPVHPQVAPPPPPTGVIYDHPKTNINGESLANGGGELYEKFKQQKQNKESDYIMNGNPTIMPPTPMMNQLQQQQPLSQQNGNGSNGGGPLNGTNGSNGLARPTQLMDELGGRDLEHHRSCGVDKQLRKIDEIFMNQKENEVRIVESRTSHNCSVHGSHRRGSVCSLAATAASKKRDYVVGSSMADLRRPSYGSIYNVGREEEMAKRKARLANRNSIAHFGDLYSASSLGANRFNPDRRRDSLPVLNKPVRPMEHPSDFPSMLRTTSVSTVDLRRKPSVTTRSSTASKRSSLNLDDHHIHLPFATSTGKLHSILKNKASSPSKDSETSTSDQDLCDLTKRLSFDSGIAKQPLLSNRRNSNDSSYSSYSRRISIDSLDARRNSRRFSDVSSMFGAGDDDTGSTCGTTGGGIDLDRIRLLNRNFSNSFGGASGDKREVRETQGE
ncbi:hypothetical protein pipiens_009026 [Culex pipiens pipiens]|uniref:CTLH domain-containing protein n=1 Tax=Culex pipiens pipiens TaxID=38569 RepID=A0ABD1DFM1_CULPP